MPRASLAGSPGLARSHGNAGRVIEGLRALYAAPEWTLLEQVRNATGVPDVLRIADAIAIRTIGRGPLVEAARAELGAVAVGRAG